MDNNNDEETGEASEVAPRQPGTSSVAAFTKYHAQPTPDTDTAGEETPPAATTRAAAPPATNPDHRSRNRSLSSATDEEQEETEPPAKRPKPDDVARLPAHQPMPEEPETPTMEVTHESVIESVEDQKPAAAAVRMVRREGSVASDLSSASAETEPARHDQAQSPPPVQYAAAGYSEIPPAPPSTPASQSNALSIFDDPNLTNAMTVPMLNKGSFDTRQLELQQQMLYSEGPETPAAVFKPAASRPSPSQQAMTPRGPATAAPRHLPEDFSEWAVGDRYELVRMLGRGSYGEVAQAIDLRAGRRDAYVAIKRIQSPFDQEVDSIRLYREIHILRRISHHSCIIQLLDVVQPPTDDLDDFHDLYLVFEYVDTDLYKLIMSPQYLTTEHIQTFLYQMLAGLNYIHSFSVIHRDLKPANILLNEDCSLKICDFGLARIVDPDKMSTSAHGTKKVEPEVPQGARSPNASNFPVQPPMGLTRQLTKHVVTRWYRAPELILIQPYTSAVDIWSTGCIFAELLSMQEGNVPSYQDRKPIFPGGTCYPLSGEGDSVKTDDRLDQLSVIFAVIGTPSAEDLEESGKANEYIETLAKKPGKPLEKLYPVADPAALDLLKKMLQFNPKKRITAAAAMEHEFFKGVRRKELEVCGEGPLEGPDFLETSKIDLKMLKQQIYDEVLWYRDHGLPSMPHHS